MKYKIVRQHSQEDCGAACLAAIAKYYERNIGLNRIREAVGTGQLGTTLLGLIQGAETLGFNARAVRATPEILDRMKEAPLPAVIHWKGNHWVLLYGQRGKKYVLADPGIGIRYLTRPLDFARQVLRLLLNYYETHRSNEVVSRLRDIRGLNQLLCQTPIQLPVLFFRAAVSQGLMSILLG